MILLENVEHCGGEPEQADTACLLAIEMGARRTLLCPLCSLSPGTGVPVEGLFVYMLSVSWRGSRGRHVSGVWLHMHGLSFYTRILS